MLQSLDVVVGFAGVMLGISLIITTVSQMISGALGLRGTNLRWGLKTLLEQAGLKDAATLAQEVLSHPLVSDSTFSKFAGRILDRWRLATAIRRPELTGILDKLATSHGHQLVTPTNAAFIEQWFDTIMDRVSQRFATSMRFWCVGFAVVAAFGLHLDSIQLIRRLSEDSATRASVLAGVQGNLRRMENTQPADLGGDVAKIQSILASTGLQIIPDYSSLTWADYRKSFFGMLITAAFLSLGAPFWYNGLKTFLNLRPVLAMRMEGDKDKGKDQSSN